ncbi:MauE/DoxX family redox-associated membrane protein [uncultured Corynebacterium sp.]|uniref:MauE/DoxX family redox-associated membrane protein n=1 Tax=uncultured Corynebacterium sp. TaxID=159447 RepID=UPI002608DA91|nr:MauE/DoxX family redox-associated membrane protein [uncultured Corynebacterium sp.]
MQQDAPVAPTRDRVLDVLSALARFGLAFMWIYAGVTKLGNRLLTTQSIEAYEIFTPYWSHLLAGLIGPLEIAGGLLLLLGIKLRPTGWVSVVVLLLFIIGLASAYSRGLQIDCGCFGSNPDSSPADLLWAIARDVGLTAVTLFMIYRPFKKFALYP